MELYNKFRSCPKEAQKQIQAGRLKGKTDINPMWRLKMLTEAFGPCGFGWTLRIVRMWIEDGAEKRQYNDCGELIGSNVEKTANVEIALRVNYKGEWSEDIPGIGGAMFVELESRGFNTEDEAYKKAYTDAISVACKALGIAADIYFANDPDSKYYTNTQGQTQPQSKPAQKPQNAPQNTQKPQGGTNTHPTPQNATQRAQSAPATADVPFPEVADSPSGGGIVTFQEAIEFIMPSGTYTGEKLTDVYKKDLKYLRTLCNMPGTDQKIIGAVSALDNAVMNSRAEKQA
jgi:hypothetical protein